MITAQQFIDEARKLKGVPWRHRGRTTNGVDCIGVFVLAARNAGLDLAGFIGIPDRRGYGSRASPELIELVRKHALPAEQPVPGCLLVFQFPGESLPRHFGILTENGNMIHAEAKTRMQVVEHGYRCAWVRRTHSIWLMPGVIYGA